MGFSRAPLALCGRAVRVRTVKTLCKSCIWRPCLHYMLIIQLHVFIKCIILLSFFYYKSKCNLRLVKLNWQHFSSHRMSIYSQKCVTQNIIQYIKKTLNAMCAVRTMYAGCLCAVSTLQQLIVRCKSVMNAVRTSWGRRRDVVCTYMYNW